MCVLLGLLLYYYRVCVGVFSYVFAIVSTIWPAVRSASQSPSITPGLIQSGPASQSERGWAAAPSRSPYHCQPRHSDKDTDRRKGKKEKGKGIEKDRKKTVCEQKDHEQGGQSEIKKKDWRKADAATTTCVRAMFQFINVCVVWLRTDRPCVWPCVCVTALPRRTWAAGVETSAGNTMVRSSWWVPPTKHSSVCCPLSVSSSSSLLLFLVISFPFLCLTLSFKHCIPFFSVGMDGQQRGTDESWRTGCGPALCFASVDHHRCFFHSDAGYSLQSSFVLFWRCWCRAAAQCVFLWLITKLLSHCCSGGACVCVWAHIPLLWAESVDPDSPEGQEVLEFNTPIAHPTRDTLWVCSWVLRATCVSD